MSIRTERVASVIRHELGTMISREYSGGEFGFSTVTEVRVTADLKLAKVYISVLGNVHQREMTMTRLAAEKPHIRAMLASHLNMRFTPDLLFYSDTTMDTVENLERLIKKIHDDDNHKAGQS
ncbi:MAG: 30S ribosome-binding factor RbfA [Bacteroidota bacterium]|nr:30S ribosome-binding factor RbfA [Bacteroidota bacterium]